MRVARVAFGVIGVANVVALLSPSYAVLLLSRLLVGAGTAPSFVGSLNAARRAGGASLAGLFGGLTLLASGSAIVLGSQFADAGISWRWNFAIAAAIAFGAVVIGPRDDPRHLGGVVTSSLDQVRVVIRERALWRLVLLYAATFGANFVLSIWIVEFVAPGASAKETAGLIGFVVLGASAGFRWWGGILSDRGVSWNLIAPGATLVAAAAMAVFAVTQWIPLAFALAVLIGFGLALPFGAIFTASFRAVPEHPAAGIAMVNMSAAVFAVVTAPLVGLAFDQRHPWLLPSGLAAFAVVAALANLRRSATAG
jgi:predicted MFS family arabinose efflux permease